MPKIVFDMLHVPVPNHLVSKLKMFSDGCLGIQGVRISVFNTKMFFHVLSWEDVENLHCMNVSLGEYVGVMRKAITSREEKLLLRRVEYAAKKGVCSCRNK